MSQEQGHRLTRAVGLLAVAIGNNSMLLEAGYDLALLKPDKAKRYELRIKAARQNLKTEFVSFVAQLETILSHPMPWRALGCKDRKEAMALLQGPPEDESSI